MRGHDDTWTKLPKPVQDRVRVAMVRPATDLATKVARFEHPFEYLKNVTGGFFESRRFVLNKVLAGDPRAVAVRESEIGAVRSHRLNQPFPQPFEAEGQYLTDHLSEFEEFRKTNYPWADRGNFAKPHPDIDAVLNARIAAPLSDYGFVRTRTKAPWEIESRSLAVPVVIRFDKGSYGMILQPTLRVPAYGFLTPLGDPFYFSGQLFFASANHDFDGQMAQFADSYVRIFPHVFAALERGMAAASEIVAGTA